MTTSNRFKKNMLKNIALFGTACALTMTQPVNIFASSSSSRTLLSKSVQNNLSGAVFVNTENFSLSNKTLSEDFSIITGQGKGNISFSNVTVKGTTNIYGTGDHAVTIGGNSSLSQVQLNKSGTPVQLSVDSTANVSSLVLGKNNADTVINGTVPTIKALSEGSKISLNGSATEVTVNGKDTAITINGTIDSLTISKDVGNATLVVAENASVKNVQTSANVNIEGKGQVEKVVAQENNIKVDTSSNTTPKIETAPGVSGVTSNGSNISSPTTGTGSSSGSNSSNTGNTGSDSNSGNNGSSSSSDSTNKPSMAETTGLSITSVESLDIATVRLTLNKSYPELTQDMLSIICTSGGSDMTVLGLHNVDNYQTFDIKTTHYDDNSYNLAIVFSDNSLIDKDFIVKHDAPQLSSLTVERKSNTEATFSYSADEPGTLYYLLKPVETSKSFGTKAVHAVPNELDGITEDIMLKTGTAVTMNRYYNEIPITGLEEGVSYTLYYMAVGEWNRTSLIQKLPITSEVAPEDTADFSITNATGTFIDNANFGDEMFYFTVQLSSPVKLELSNFTITCSAGPLSLGRVETADNQTYKVYMKAGYIPFDKNTVKVTIQTVDGKTATKGCYLDYTGPKLTKYNLNATWDKEKENTLNVPINSDKAGTFYWAVLQPNETFDPQDLYKSGDPSIVLSANPKENTLLSGEATYKLALDASTLPKDVKSYLCVVGKDEKGQYSDWMIYYEIPTYVAPEKPEQPDDGTGDTTPEPFTINHIDIYNGFAGTTGFSINTTPSDLKIGSIAGTKIDVYAADGQTHIKTFTIGDGITNSDGERSFTINYPFQSGTYKMVITLNYEGNAGRVGEGTFTIS